MATTKIPTMLRLPEDLHLKTKKIAQIEHRSVNAEIEFILEKYISNYESENGTLSINTDELYQ